MKFLRGILVLAVIGIFCISCQERTPKEKVKDGYEEMKDGVKDAAKKTKESVKDAADDVKDGVNETTKKVKDDLD